MCWLFQGIRLAHFILYFDYILSVKGENGVESMGCREYVYDERFYDFIFENNAAVYDDTAKGCRVRIDDNWSAGYGELPKGLGMSVTDLNYHIIPKLYTTAEVSGLDASGISSVINQPTLDVKGRGVIIGMIDDGVDYTIDALKSSPVNSRVGVIWDQNIRMNLSDAGSDEGRENIKTLNVPYGRVYDNKLINASLAAYEEGEEELSVPVADRRGHGTAVAAVAAVSAPECEFAVVRLKPAKKYLKDYFLIADEEEVYEETDICLGVRFLLDYAASQRKPLVLLISLVTGSGPRTGATPLASVLALAAGRTNVAVVAAVGNEANSRTHISGVAQSSDNPYVCELNVGARAKGFVVELWAATIDILSVGFVSPSGEIVARIPAKERTQYAYDFVFEKTRITVGYQVVEELSGYELIFIRFIAPAPGIWRINVYSLTTIQGIFNVWLPIKKLMDSDTFFLDSVPEITLLEPSADGKLISVGAYNQNSGSADIDSGRGYNAMGIVKPDIVAPGTDIEVESVSPKRIVSGTSVAAAYVAGMAALLLQWGVVDGNDRLMGNNQVRSILARGAVRSATIVEEGVGYPDNISGYGRANILDSFLQLRIK